MSSSAFHADDSIPPPPPVPLTANDRESIRLITAYIFTQTEYLRQAISHDLSQKALESAFRPLLQRMMAPIYASLRQVRRALNLPPHQRAPRSQRNPQFNPPEPQFRPEKNAWTAPNRSNLTQTMPQNNAPPTPPPEPPAPEIPSEEPPNKRLKKSVHFQIDEIFNDKDEDEKSPKPPTQNLFTQYEDEEMCEPPPDPDPDPKPDPKPTSAPVSPPKPPSIITTNLVSFRPFILHGNTHGHSTEQWNDAISNRFQCRILITKIDPNLIQFTAVVPHDQVPSTVQALNNTKTIKAKFFGTRLKLVNPLI